MAKKRHRWTKHEASKAGKKGMQERYRERRTKLARMIDRLVAKGWSKNKASKHARKLLKEREER